MALRHKSLPLVSSSFRASLTVLGTWIPYFRFFFAIRVCLSFTIILFLLLSNVPTYQTNADPLSISRLTAYLAVSVGFDSVKWDSEIHEHEPFRHCTFIFHPLVVLYNALKKPIRWPFSNKMKKESKIILQLDP